MFKFLLRKIFYSFFVILGIITVIFLLFNIIPADPAKMMLGDRDDAVQLENIRKKYNLDKPVFERYFLYLNDLSPVSFHNSKSKNLKNYDYVKILKIQWSHISVSNNETLIVIKKPYLGESFFYKNRKVTEIIFHVFPNTLVLAISSILLALLISIPIGVVCAIKKDSFFDRFFSLFGVLGMSLPSFFSAILIMWLFAYKLNWLTNLNVVGSLYEVDDLGRGEYMTIKNLILPTITLGIRPIAVIMNLTRNSLLEILSSNYIRTARAKGLSEFKVVVVHGLRTSLSSVLTAASGWFASMLSGAVFVEYIFGWNGIGKLLVESINNMDFPLVMGLILFIGVCFVFINILVDLIYSRLDPRVKIN